MSEYYRKEIVTECIYGFNLSIHLWVLMSLRGWSQGMHNNSIKKDWEKSLKNALHSHERLKTSYRKLTHPTDIIWKMKRKD